MASGKELLEKWLNPSYLQEDILAGLKKFFEENTETQYMQWQDFLNQNKAKTILRHFQRCHYKKSYRPDIYRYSEAKQYPLLVPFVNFLKSEAMQAYIQQCAGESYLLKEKEYQQVMSFEKGDYTLLHDQEETKEGLILSYSAVTEWDQEWGGYEVITNPNKDPVLVLPMPNTLTIIKATRNTRIFTKYNNNLSQEKKRYVLRIMWKIKQENAAQPKQKEKKKK